MRDILQWRGIGASSGYATGKTWILAPESHSLPVSDNRVFLDADSEVQRLMRAVNATEESLLKLEAKVKAEQGEEVAQIFATHRMLLHDPSFSGEACDRIRRTPHLSAEQAITQVAEETMAVFKQMEDEYFRERSADIKAISGQLLQALNAGCELSDGNLFPAEGRYIVIAEELTPAQTVNLPKDRILGFIVHRGGKTSHAAILARTYGIPAVIGDTLTWEELKSFEAARIDGDEGWIEQLTLEQLATAAPVVDTASWDENNEAIPPEFDGLILAANIGGPTDLGFVKKFQAQGIGLYRTEFLFMGEKLPSEAEQVEAYREVIAACQPCLTVIRTLDIGGDK